MFWPNIVIDFEKYLISYSTSNSLELFPDNAVALYVTKEEEVERIIPTFGALLANFLTVVRVIRPMLFDYLDLKSSNVIHVPLPEDSSA